MVSARRLPCESQGVTRGVVVGGEKVGEKGTRGGRKRGGNRLHAARFTGLNIPSLVFCIARVSRIEKGEGEGWLGRRKVGAKETIYMYMRVINRGRRGSGEKKRRERVTGAKISDLDHTRLQEKSGGRSEVFYDRDGNRGRIL